MLSRVADSLYWMARSIERAENLARLVEVNRGVLLDSQGGVGWSEDAFDVSTRYPALVSLAAGGIEPVLQHLDLLLYAGRMPAEVRTDIVEAVASVTGTDAESQVNRARVAVLMALTHPDYLVQR